MADLIDAAGIPLADHALWLPRRACDFEFPKDSDPTTLATWREDWAGKPCWWCGHKTYGRLGEHTGELHHMARYDATWAYSWLCATCHRLKGDAVKASSLHRLLTLKHQYDQPNTLWVQLALGLGRFLPVDPCCNICGDALAGDECEICSACGGG